MGHHTFRVKVALAMRAEQPAEGGKTSPKDPKEAFGRPWPGSVSPRTMLEVIQGVPKGISYIANPGFKPGYDV